MIRRPRLAPRSLRARLLAVLLVLLALICVTVSVAVSASLHHFLIRQLDGQLAQAGRRADRLPQTEHQGRLGAGRLDGLLRPPAPPTLGAQPPGTLVARLGEGQVIWGGVVSASGEARRFTATEVKILSDLPVDGRPHTRDLGAAGAYRIAAGRGPFGGVTITGLPLSGVADTMNRLVLVEVVVSAAALLVLGVAGAFVVRGTLRPLRRVAGTATRVAQLPLHTGDVALAVRVPEEDTDTATEVGRVGAALNRLLDHVGAALAARQASEVRVRQFVADASHELRTPLAAIRGYAELVRRLDGSVPGDVAHAMRRVESEAGRMSLLVEDLLLLARLDAGRPLAREPVDLSRLLVDAVSDARIAGPRQQWRLELPGEPVTVEADAARLHQVVANLLGNARQHTPAGTRVTASLAAGRTGDVVITVTDDGPGIPAAVLPDVFGRFVRADRSRSRGGGGTGLGLAIVAAVVRAHHGTVAVRRGAGRTAVTVRLPRGGPADTPEPAAAGGTRAPAPPPGAPRAPTGTPEDHPASGC